ncbi:MAG: response regulator receiver protein [Phycisphaerales bacterium]|nr:response regulator receiver protein [Phycisphaerales bacterium]
MPYRLLIVDASATARAMVKRALRQTEFASARVAEAAGGAEAIDLLQQHPFDLILIAPDLPGGDGPDLIGRVVAEPDTRATPVVLMTADLAAAPALVRRLRARGHLAKPVRPADLQAALARLLEPTHV